MYIYKALLFVLVCNLTFAYGFHQPDLASFGDFMEYYLSVSVACTNVANGTDVIETTNRIFKSFADCTTEITSTSSKHFGNLKLICDNQGKYLKCWDQLKDDIIINCQQNARLPAVYTATVKSLCGNDNGNTTVSNLRKASATITEEDQNNCPESTGIHWMDNCKSSLPTMISENLCERQDALDKCLEKITCINFEFGRLNKQVYTGGRAYLNCGQR